MSLKFRNIHISLAIALILFFIIPFVSHAITFEECLRECTETAVDPGFCARTCAGVSDDSVSGGTDTTSEGGTIDGGRPFDNPVGSNSKVQDVVADVLRGVLGIVGVAALVMFIYGGLLWLTSAGNQTRITMGRETLRWAAIGLAIVFTSFALVNFILGALGGSG